MLDYISLISDIIEKNNNSFLEKEKNFFVQGWIRNVRVGKNFCFFELNDGSCIENLQIIFVKEKFIELDKVKIGSYLLISGSLVEKRNINNLEKNKYDFKLNKIIVLNKSVYDNEVLQKKKLPLEFVRKYPEFRIKTNFYLSIFRIRSSVFKFIHDFFYLNNFTFVSSPLITNIDAESAGETFSISSSSQPSFEKKQLTVSGQLHLEFLAQGLGKVYNCSPCFRAEKSHTTRHLSEFWMLEAELICSDLDTLMDLSENLIKFVIKSVLEKNYSCLKSIENYQSNLGYNLVNYLENISQFSFKFKKIEYREILNLLNNNFSFNLKFGDNFSYEQEKIICNYFNSPVFVTNFPIISKAFYMMKSIKNDDTVEGFDLLFPNVGEIIGGSVREKDYLILEKAIKEKKIKNMENYARLRNLGYGTTAGFGLGVDRLIMFICGINNIQDSIPFPFSL